MVSLRACVFGHGCRERAPKILDAAHLGERRACGKLTHHPLTPTRGVCEDTPILTPADGQKTITVRHSKLMHHRLTGVPELLGTSHSAYETAVESFRALVRVKMAATRLEEYLGILRQSPQGDAGRRLDRVSFGAGADLKLQALQAAERLAARWQ